MILGLVKEDEDRILAAAGTVPTPIAPIAAATGYQPAQIGQVLRRHGWKMKRQHDGPRMYHPPVAAVTETPATPTTTPKTTGTVVRVIIPDSHGSHIDPDARDAFLVDLRRLDPDEIVMLGDHLDCGGTFNSHQRTYTAEMTESYDEDVNCANQFLDAIQAGAPRARVYYLEGNHEQHVERWAARNFDSRRDADKMLETFGPEAVLHLQRRSISYYRRSVHYQNINVPGTIKLGKCYFTHGIGHSKNAATTHVERFAANVVFGHLHRRQSFGSRTVTSHAHDAWCPGTLAKLQPLYMHTSPSGWTHGYGVQFVAASGNFAHLNVPIVPGGASLLEAVFNVRGA